MNYSYEAKSVWKQVDSKEKEAIHAYAKRYMAFSDASKTEREACTEIIRQARAQGYISLEEAYEKGTLVPGEKIYADNKHKSVVLFVIGTEDPAGGLNIVGSHIDAPRLDLKPNPLYEEGDLALLKTHYYGGVKKYQWVCTPLALHGVLHTKDGTKVEIAIGEDENDPVFYINDLLIHLSQDQMKKTMSDGVTGEQLNIVIGHDSSFGEEKESSPIKAHILSLLHKKYGMVEEDFFIAELQAVPAQKAREVGLDRSMIAAHGHDDRVCAYATLEAIFSVEQPKRTVAALFMDKEEIGSVGNTGMTSDFFSNVLAELIDLDGGYSSIRLRRCLASSKVLSADVTVAFDPTFAEVVEKQNTARSGFGICMSKYTGSRGKSGSNDANAEYLAQVRSVFEEADIVWQVGELGKVDQGGGGTIAYILAECGAEVVDCGVPMLSMHAPVELVSKADAYMAAKAYRAFLKADFSNDYTG